ncbi:MAG: RpiB/LacA/LacB family sugar-phosphate isomerase, partial [Propionibacteriaceae bacterium]|nr:RpiB/LacA/LacB family sugar-phosphate isomerase [Propionibacteriaceae bacterium]
MRVHIATDHAAFELKEFLVGALTEAGYEVVDHGAHTYDTEDDYPDTCIPCAEAVAAEGALGVVLGGSGNGEQIAANKVPGIRAALANDVELAKLAREHNDANVISIGGRFTT